MATPVFCCGFECGVSGPHWTATGSFSTTNPRSGSRCFNANGSNERVVSPAVHTSTTRHIGRFYVRFNTSLPAAAPASIRLSKFNDDIFGPSVSFKISDSKIYASVSNTLGATGVAVTTGQWYRIDYDYNVNTGGNDTCDVQVDGVACGQATATGTSTGGSTDAFGLCDPITTGDIDIEDVLLSSTAADYPLGAGYVNHFVPTADGTHNIAGTGDFQRTLTGTDILNATTTAFQLVDEIPLETIVTDWINLVAPPNATDYVECVFGPAPGIQIPVLPPRTVEVVCGINQAGTGTGNMEIRLNDNGTTGTIYTATGVAGVAVATGQQFKRAHFVDPPSAASAWTLSGDGNFNNLRIRFGSPGAVDANPDQYFGCALIEAEFPAQLDASMYTRPYGPTGQNLMNQLLAT